MTDDFRTISYIQQGLVGDDGRFVLGACKDYIGNKMQDFSREQPAREMVLEQMWAIQQGAIKDTRIGNTKVLIRSVEAAFKYYLGDDFELRIKNERSEPGSVPGTSYLFIDVQAIFPARYFGSILTVSMYAAISRSWAYSMVGPDMNPFKELKDRFLKTNDMNSIRGYLDHRDPNYTLWFKALEVVKPYLTYWSTHMEEFPWSKLDYSTVHGSTGFLTIMNLIIHALKDKTYVSDTALIQLKPVYKKHLFRDKTSVFFDLTREYPEWEEPSSIPPALVVDPSARTIRGITLPHTRMTDMHGAFPVDTIGRPPPVLPKQQTQHAPTWFRDQYGRFTTRARKTGTL